MRFRILFSGAAIVGLGIYAHQTLDRADGYGFLSGALALGGGILICGFFSFAMKWQGIIGAGILALLGAGRGLFNLKDLALFLTGERERGPASLLEFGVTAICLILMLSVLRELGRERIRRMLAEEEPGTPPVP